VGRVSWAPEAPVFVFDEEGGSELWGKAENYDFGGPSANTLALLGKSHIFNKHLAHYIDPFQQSWSADEVRVMFAIVEESASIVGRRFPEAEFHVLVWETNSRLPYSEEYIAMLEGAGIRIHQVGEVIADYKRPRDSRYHLHLHDGHPSVAAHEKIADYVVRDILNGEVSADAPEAVSD
jgi:hypothetical protein